MALVFLPLWLVPGAIARGIPVALGMQSSWATPVAIIAPPMGNFMVAYWRWMFWPCPSCRRPFHVSWIYGNPFARRCVHCGPTVSSQEPDRGERPSR